MDHLTTAPAPPEPRVPLQRVTGRLRRVLGSRAFLVIGVAASLVVPALTLPQVPRVSPWPVLAGLLPWVVGKYLLCPLRWRAVTGAGFSRRWHVRAYAESELCGLLTPGHVGADVWRLRRLTSAGLRTGDAVVSVATDRLVGALGLAGFVLVSGAALPWRLVVVGGTLAAAALALVVVLRRLRPDLLPSRPLPRPRVLAHGLLLSAAYQLSITALLLGSVTATGNDVSPVAVLAAFGASQFAGAVPGPHGASPRDAALVVALAGAGVPLVSAVAAVSLTAALAWLPALTLGGTSMLLHRRTFRLAA